MKIVPVATNHILIELDNGEILDVNDGTLTPTGGIFSVALTHPTNRFLKCKQEVDGIKITMPRLINV